jgi:pilus assembly protein CpaC
MHRSSKRWREKSARRWNRALFAAAFAASLASGSFVFGQASVPARKKLPTKRVTPVALTTEATSTPLSPISRVPVMRPMDVAATNELKPELKPEVKPKPKAKLISKELRPTENQPEEHLAPIVAASSLSRPGQKRVKQSQVEQKPLTADPEPELSAAPLSPWMQDIRISQREIPSAEKNEAPLQKVAAPKEEGAPARPLTPPNLPARRTIFERAAIPTLPGTEVSGTELPETEVVVMQVAAQEPAPILPGTQAEPLARVMPPSRLLAVINKQPRAKSWVKTEVKEERKGEANDEPLAAAVRNTFVRNAAMQEEAAQPPAPVPAPLPPPAPLAGPDRDADLKKHFEVIQQTGEFSVQVHRSKLLRTAKDIYRTAVVDDGVLEIVQFTPREISLIGRSQGATHVTFWFDDPAAQPVTYLVKVEPDAGQVKIDEEKYQLLEDMLNEMFPDSKVHLQLIANKLVVRGQARDSEEASQIMALIRAQGTGQGGAGGGGIGGNGFGGINEGQAADPLLDNATGAARRSTYQIINMLRVPGVQQVALRVKIAELNRTAARNFGLNLQGRVDISSATEGSKLLLNSILGNGGKTAPAILANFDGDDISVGLSTLSEAGVIKLLSEPTLVTLSGNPATFIAGGEFAVPTIVGSAGLNAVTTDFRAFGAIISFLPTVVDKDRIRLQVAPEFSQINSDLTVNGTPGLKVRAATTTVEMREGQTLAIAGLLDESINANTAGDIPFLSKWIGKRGVTRAETELIILVTPELVHPLEPEEVPPLPGFDVTEPTNKQFYFHGDIEGNPTMDYRSTVWPRLKKRYQAGGPAMTSGPFGHGQ